MEVKQRRADIKTHQLSSTIQVLDRHLVLIIWPAVKEEAEEEAKTTHQLAAVFSSRPQQALVCRLQGTGVLAIFRQATTLLVMLQQAVELV